MTVRPSPGDWQFEQVRLTQALAQSLGTSGFRPALIRRGEHLANAELSGWRRQPSRFDVAVVNADNEPLLVFQTSVDRISEVAWDAIKLAALAEVETIEATYLLAAMTQSAWHENHHVAELLGLMEAELPGGPNLREVTEILSASAPGWRRAFQKDKGRPVVIPTSITLTPIGAWAIPSYEGYELRAAKVAWESRMDRIDFEAVATL